MAGACLRCGEVQPTSEEDGINKCDVCGAGPSDLRAVA